MKKICLIITLLATCLANLSFCCLMYAEDTPDKVSIDLQTVKDKNHYERDLYDSIKADYYFRGSRLEISCADEGVVSVYLFTPATRCAAMPSMIQRKTLSGGLMSQSSQALTTLSLSPTSPTLKDLSPNNFSVRFISYHN